LEQEFVINARVEFLDSNFSVPSRNDDFQLFLCDPPILTRVSGRLSLYREGARGRAVCWIPLKFPLLQNLRREWKLSFHPGDER